MNSEYLLFNLIIFAGPISQSFDRRVRYVRRWPLALAAAILSLIPFIIWDALVNGRHWWFSERFTLGARLAGLPIEEWLFFLSVPFACLFIWEIIITFRPKKVLRAMKRFGALLLLGLPAGAWVFASGKEYTGLVLMALAALFLADALLKTRILEDQRTLLLAAIVLGLTLIFNTYLTARPVVLYDPQYQLDLRIITIPVEDFIYGLTHVLLTVIFYERLKGNRAR